MTTRLESSTLAPVFRLRLVLDVTSEPVSGVTCALVDPLIPGFGAHVLGGVLAVTAWSRPNPPATSSTATVRMRVTDPTLRGRLVEPDVDITLTSPEVEHRFLVLPARLVITLLDVKGNPIPHAVVSATDRALTPAPLVEDPSRLGTYRSALVSWAATTTLKVDGVERLRPLPIDPRSTVTRVHLTPPT